MAYQINDNDFPIGRKYPSDHPKRVLLKKLAEQNAREYADAVKSSDWPRPDGVTRSKTKIIDDIIAILMPPDGGGHYKEKKKCEKKCEWVVIDNEPDIGIRVRTMVASHLKKAVKSLAPQPAVKSLAPQPELNRIDNANESTENHPDVSARDLPSFPPHSAADDKSNDEKSNGEQHVLRLDHGSTDLRSDDFSRLSVALGDGSAASVDFVNQNVLHVKNDGASTEKYDFGDASITQEPLGSVSHIDGRAQRQNHDDDINTDVRMVSKPGGARSVRERVHNIHGAAPSDMQTVHSVSSSIAPTSLSSMATSLQMLSIDSSKKELTKAGNTSKLGHALAGSKAPNERMKATLMPPSNDANAPSNHAKILHEHPSGDKHSRSGSSAVCPTEPQNQRQRCHSAPPSDRSCNLGSHDSRESNDSVNNEVNNFSDVRAPSSTASLSLFSFRSSTHGNKHSGSELSTKSTEQPRKKHRSSFPSGNINDSQWRAKHTDLMVSVMSKPSMGSAVLDMKGTVVQHVPENVTINSKPPLGQPGQETGYHVSPSVATGKEINISRRGGGVSTVISGLGYDGGKSVDQLLEDLRNPQLDESEIATRLDDLLDVAISNNSSSWSSTFQNNVTEVMGHIMKKNLDNQSLQIKSFHFLGSYYAGNESFNVPGALVHQLMEVLNSSHHENDEEIQCNGLWLMGVTMNEENIKKIYIDANGTGGGFFIKKCEQFRDNAAIQANGCRALGHLASNNNVNQKAIMEANGIDVILNAMTRHKDDSNVQTEGCRALVYLASENNVNQNAIMEPKGIDFILNAIKLHEDDSDVQHRGCYSLGQLAINNFVNKEAIKEGCRALGYLASENNVNQKAIMQAKGIDFILNVIKQHEDDSDVQHRGCYALGQLAINNYVNQKAIMEANGIDVILNVMKQHEDHYYVQQEGCRALGHLASNNYMNQKAIMDGNGIAFILNAMKRHKNQSDVQDWGCYALGQLAYNNTVNQEAIMEANGIDVILNAMKQHKDHSDVQKYGCWSLGHLAHNNDLNQNAIMEANGIDLILNAMKRHEDHSNVQQEGCWSLGQLVFDNTVNQIAIIEANGIGVILNAMKRHEDHSNVQLQGCRSLGQLAFDNNVNQTAITEANGIYFILNAMRRHEDHSDVQHWGCYALGQLAYNNTVNQEAIMEANGIDVILNAMKRHKHHSNVREEGCKSLGQLVYDNEVNRKAIMETNCIDVILNAMKRHEDHSDVRKHGCRALGHLVYDNEQNQNAMTSVNVMDVFLQLLNGMENIWMFNGVDVLQLDNCQIWMK